MQIPTQSWANGLVLDDIPPELRDLRPLEIRLISQRIPFMKLVRLPRGGQKVIHGSAVNVPCKLQPVTFLLPRLPNNVEVVAVKLKRKLAYKGHYMYEYVRPKRVMAALRWLQENNHLYSDINVCQDWETYWKNDDADLWNAMTNACTEQSNVDHAIENSDTAADGLNECRHASQYETNFSPSSSGNDYQLLEHLARRQNFRMKDVPGDGNCFFHAVSFCLQVAGIQVISGPDIRTALIQYFQTTEEKRDYMGFLSFQNTTFTNAASIEEQQVQEFELYINRLGNGEWADNLAVQGVADMLNVNIKVINTITPNWIHHIQPRHLSSNHTITLGQIGELHYVALENDEQTIENDEQTIENDEHTIESDEQTIENNKQTIENDEETIESDEQTIENDKQTIENDEQTIENDERTTENESRIEEARKQIQDEEDIIAFEQTSKLRGIPYDTLLRDEQQLVDDDSTYSIAPGDGQTPCAFLWMKKLRS